MEKYLNFGYLDLNNKKKALGTHYDYTLNRLSNLFEILQKIKNASFSQYIYVLYMGLGQTKNVVCHLLLAFCGWDM